MQYSVEGTPLPVVICQVEPGEVIVSERGGMTWMSQNMVMETKGGGIGKMFGRAFSGEAMFQNRFHAEGGTGEIAFASSYPGAIIPFEITPSKGIIAQKSAFLASTDGVELSMYFQKKLGAGFFGGEGFIMQRMSGQGIAFVEIDGHCVEYELAPGQSMMIDTGHLAAMEETVSIDIQMIKGMKNMFLGGEGMFNTKVTGPGKIWLQTMPLSGLVGLLTPFFTK